MPREIQGVDYLEKFHVNKNKLWHRTRMNLPAYFVEKYRREWGSHVRIRLHNSSEETLVRVTISGGHRGWLSDGWEEFLERNNLEGNYFMCFKYLGRSRFTVTAEPHEFGNTSDNYIAEFSIVMRPSHVTRDYIEVPSSHVNELFNYSDCEEVKFITQDRVEYLIGVEERFTRGSRKARRVSFKYGWLVFVEMNNIKVGDVVNFGMLDNQEMATYKVTITRAG